MFANSSKIFLSNTSLLAILMLGLTCKGDPPPQSTRDGVVVHVNGQAIRARQDKQTALKFRDTIETGDQVLTKKQSSVSIQIAEVGIVRMAANSKFTFESMDEGAIKGRLDEGNIGAKFKKLKKNIKVSLQTPTTVAAVRGTIFGLTINKKGQTVVAVTEGKVAVQPIDGGSEEVVAKNKAAVVTKAGAIKVRDIAPREKRTLGVLKDAEVVPNIKTLNDQKAQQVFDEYQEREQKLGKKPSKKKVFKNLGEMKEEYEKLDEIKLYNGKTIQGKILQQKGQFLIVQVPGGMQKIAKKDVASRKVLK